MKFKKYYTDTDQLTSFPALIQASGEPLVDYTISGNTGGVGDEWDNILVNAFTDKTPQEANGLTITVSNGTITVNGTANANTNLCFVNNTIGSVTFSTYQVIDHGIYLLDGNPLDAAENKYILSYKYDPDGSGGTPSSQARVAVGQPSEIDNSTGDYTYIAMYFAIWRGTVCNNITFTPSIRKKGYKIPITSGGVTTNLPIDSPLGLTDTLTYTQTGIAIPTFDGDNTITFGTTIQPSGMSAEFKGWHSQDNVRVYNGNTWD